ncbi:hypothetical protein BJ138DRAFT_1103478 [Hygrophoropsis aurantiaca]|uniref:Uncharacterized protein n=1 Tax=Hygrophoropsis aurantiaca TaxID=72124 RepID=A0ACB8A5W6_9AGAM|nr:hypothetical protein BJ138DRAFT_1103478 [Hygrophoropsis aurantiaca]
MVQDLERRKIRKRAIQKLHLSISVTYRESRDCGVRSYFVQVVGGRVTSDMRHGSLITLSPSIEVEHLPHWESDLPPLIVRKLINVMRSSKQREATKRWLAGPGVLDIQREKARIRAQKKKAEDVVRTSALPSSSANQFSANEIPESLFSTRSRSRSPRLSLPAHTVHNASLESIRQATDAWKVDWECEFTWSKEFDNALQRSREKGLDGVNRFFSECEKHTREGRQILRDIKKVSQGSWKGGETSIREQVICLHDLVLEVAREVKFFELKYNDYNPVVPIWKVSELRYHDGFE